jgi:hypothetical protein
MMPAKGLAYSVSRRYGDSCSGSNLSFTAARSLIAASDPQFSPATQNHEKQVAHWQSRQVDQDGAIPMKNPHDLWTQASLALVAAAAATITVAGCGKRPVGPRDCQPMTGADDDIAP